MGYVWAAVSSRGDGAKWGNAVLGMLCSQMSDDDVLAELGALGTWRSIDGVEPGDPGLWVARQMAVWHSGTGEMVPGVGCVGDVARRLHVGRTRPVAMRARARLWSATTLERDVVADLLRASRAAWRRGLRGPGCPPLWSTLWSDLSSPDEMAVLARWRAASAPPTVG